MSPLTPVAVFLVFATATIFIATTDGKDIRVKYPSPPKECQPNAHVAECASTCKPTCENKDNPPNICPLMCMENACVCDEGFYKRKDSACVRAEDCV